MLYLSEKEINKIGIDWEETIEVIEKAVKCLENNDFSQPIKPYLRYRNLKNRIIAMPAFLGDDFNIAGIKWISSFPDNIKNSLPRAHSVVVLNEADTGKPFCIINTPLLSVIRTVSVSGLMIKYFDKARSSKKLEVGMTGWGPIGQYHYKMIQSLFPNKVNKFKIFDISTIKKSSIGNPINIVVANNWQEAYRNSDIFITCTTSNYRYIDEKPRNGALILNVSLRDFKEDIYKHVKGTILVDNWDEVCRENTDIELMSKRKELKKENTKSIIDVVTNKYFEKIPENKPVMFNPMGMGIFDMAIAKYYFDKAIKSRIGKKL